MLQPARAVDGGQWKRRWHGKLDHIIVQVLQTKEGAPSPVDIIKPAMNLSGMIVPCILAYRALQNDVLAQKKASLKKYPLIVRPHLEEMRNCNRMSVIGGYTRGEDLDIVDLHLFPGFISMAPGYV